MDKPVSPGFSRKMVSLKMSSSPIIMSGWCLIFHDIPTTPDRKPRLSESAAALSRINRFFQSAASKNNLLDNIDPNWNKVFLELRDDSIAFFDKHFPAFLPLEQKSAFTLNTNNQQRNLILTLDLRADSTLSVENFCEQDVNEQTQVEDTASIVKERRRDCTACGSVFSAIKNRKRNCRNCGRAFCSNCSQKTTIIPSKGYLKPVRVCDQCSETLALKSKTLIDQMGFIRPVVDIKKAKLLAFQLVGLSTKPILLRAESTSAKDAWICAIAKALQAINDQEIDKICSTLHSRKLTSETTRKFSGSTAGNPTYLSDSPHTRLIRKSKNDSFKRPSLLEVSSRLDENKTALESSSTVFETSQVEISNTLEAINVPQAVDLAEHKVEDIISAFKDSDVSEYLRAVDKKGFTSVLKAHQNVEELRQNKKKLKKNLSEDLILLSSAETYVGEFDSKNSSIRIRKGKKNWKTNTLALPSTYTRISSFSVDFSSDGSVLGGGDVDGKVFEKASEPPIASVAEVEENQPNVDANYHVMRTESWRSLEDHLMEHGARARRMTPHLSSSGSHHVSTPSVEFKTEPATVDGKCASLGAEEEEKDRDEEENEERHVEARPQSRVTTRVTNALGDDKEVPELSESEWKEANMEIELELCQVRKALKLQAYIDWVISKTEAISDQNLDYMVRDAETIRDLASRLPKVTEDEFEDHLFLCRFEYLVELADEELRNRLVQCPQGLRRMIHEKCGRINLGDFAVPTPYEKRIDFKREQARIAKSLQSRKQELAIRKEAKPSKPVLKRDVSLEALAEKRDAVRQALEEEAYCKLLLRKGYRANVVVEEVEKFSKGGDLLVSFEEFEGEVERFFLEKIRRARRMNEDDSDEDWER